MILQWPWGEIEEDINIFGFGSLIDSRSVCRSVPGAVVTPAFIKGYRRIFNYSFLNMMSDTVLNVQPSEGNLNGVVFKLPKELAVEFSMRESLYDLVPVETFDWRTKEPNGNAYVCCCTDRRCLTRRLPPDILYLRDIKQACLRFGMDYYNMFMDTTFTSRGIPLERWEESKSELRQWLHIGSLLRR